jgi:hypothetical protein
MEERHSDEGMEEMHSDEGMGPPVDWARSEPRLGLQRAVASPAREPGPGPPLALVPWPPSCPRALPPPLARAAGPWWARRQGPLPTIDHRP